MGYNIAAYAVNMSEIQALHAKYTDDQWETFSEAYQHWIERCRQNSYCNYLMGFERDSTYSAEVMQTALMRYLLGQIEPQEEHSPYGYVYLVLCRLLGKSLQNSDLDYPFEELNDFFSEYGIPLDANTMLCRYAGLPFGEPSHKAMWPLLGYLKCAELQRLIPYFPAEISLEFAQELARWMRECLEKQTDLVFFWY